MLLFGFGVNSNAQGVHGSFSSGSQILKLDGGYSLDENIHVGLYYSVGMDAGVIPLPSSFGAYGRYTFDKRDVFNNNFFQVNMRPYLGASLGQIHTNEILSLDSSFSTYYGDYTTTPAKNELGYLATGGIELLYGSKSSWGSFVEIGLGKSPSYFKAMSSTISGLDTMKEPEGTSTLSFNVGVRFYL